MLACRGQALCTKMINIKINFKFACFSSYPLFSVNVAEYARQVGLINDVWLPFDITTNGNYKLFIF